MNNDFIKLINSLSVSEVSDRCNKDELEVIIEDGVISDVIRKEK